MSDKTDPGTPVVVFDYIKASNFRSIRADGVIGNITPNGHIHLALYSEREAIPRRVIFHATEDGSLGEIIESESRGSIVREMEFDIFLNLQTARSINEWLRDRIKELEDREEENDSDS